MKKKKSKVVMNQKAQTILKALLKASGHQDELLRLLPEQLAEQIQSLPLSFPFNAQVLFSSFQWTKPIHYSWFSDILKDFPSKVQNLFLSSLMPAQVEGIQQMLDLPQSTPRPQHFLRPFLMDILRKSLQEPDLLSEQHLPPSELNCLLLLEKRYLLHLVNLLGLHDLAADLRQVVDKELLAKVYKALNPEQLRFLQYCSKQHIKWISSKIGLTGWDGSKKQLNNLLHYRGLLRLAKAIIQENSSFKWHLLHRFDTGRAKIIQKEFYQKQDLTLLPYFKNQVLHLAKRYQT